jgi:hypothetical protein
MGVRGQGLDGEGERDMDVSAVPIEWRIGHNGVCARWFAPREIDLAERALPYRPVRPVEIVTRHADVALSLVTVRTPPASTSDGPHDAIHYLFGTIPVDADGRMNTTLPEPRYVAVHQMPGAGWERRVKRTTYRITDGRTGDVRTVFGPWQFHARLPYGRRLLIESNAPRELVEAMGDAIVARAVDNSDSGYQQTCGGST